MSRLLPLLIGAVVIAGAPISSKAQTVTIFTDFDGVVEPELPTLWTALGTGWATSTSSSSPGSGGNNLTHSGSNTGSVTTPDFNLSATSGGQVSYLARRTSSYPQDGLALFASFDGGTTFPVVVAAPGEALPNATSTYVELVFDLPLSLADQSAVRFRFDATGGSTGGSNIRIDDLLISALADTTTPPPLPTGNTIGFRDSSSVILESTDTAVPLRLSTADTLGAVQFTVTWPSAPVSFLGLEPGLFISDSTRWRVDWEIQNESVRVLVLGNDASGIPPTVYDDFLSLRFQAAALPDMNADTSIVALSDPIGALLDPSGSDAGLTVENGLYSLEIAPLQAFLSLSEDSLSFGNVAVDSIAVQMLGVSNPTGSRTLSVSSVSTDNSVFSVPDTTLTLLPGQNATVPVRYSPSDTVFGYQQGILTLVHDGTDGPTTTIPLSGTGLGGRGDADGDGLVDVMDVVISIDLVLGRIVAPSIKPAAVDLHPFPTGNAEMDVRDLTVLVQAIVRSIWPDGLGLPVQNPSAPNSPSVQSPISTSPPTASIHVDIVSDNEQDYEIFLTQDIPLRGFEMELSGVRSSEGPKESSPPSVAGTVASSHMNPDTGTLRILLARSQNDPMEPGQTWLGRVRTANSSATPIISYLAGVDQNGDRIVLSTSNVSVRTETNVTPVHQSLSLGEPYPNPFLNSGDQSLTIPLTLARDDDDSETSLEIYDVLGRLLHRQSLPRSANRYVWRPTHLGIALSPGLYFVRLHTGTHSVSRTFTVLRGS